jgi:hypothetical protein
MMAPCRSRFQAAVSLKMLWCLAGWALAIALIVISAPRIYQRATTHIPSLQEKAWRQVLEETKARVARTSWKDSRPVHVFFGDSHVEFGRWYDDCAGLHAIRNCGLAMARIEDVSEIVSAHPDRGVDAVLLLCGINNLGRGETVESCVLKYQRLLQNAQKALNPRKTFVISVPPVRQSLLDEKSRRLNQNISAFNEQLKSLCSGTNVVFINVNGVVADRAGGLLEELTADGLHLNPSGYRAVASVICEALLSNRRAP